MDPPRDGEIVAPPGEWLPRLVAAERLGLSERTVDRRCQSGKLRRRLNAEGAIEVYVTTPAAAVDVPTVTSQLAAALAPLVARNAEQEQRLLAQAAEIARLRAQLDSQRAQLLALSRLALPPPSAPWYRRLRAWLGEASRLLPRGQA